MSTRRTRGADRPILAVIGAGPKAMALAAKARVLYGLGIAEIAVLVIERSSVAANWSGRHGYTDGLQVLGTSPEKDVGFPYRSVFGPEVDRAMLQFSWPTFQVSTGHYGTWVDRGRKHPTHREWGEYLRYVFAESGPEFIPAAELTQVQFARGGFHLRLADRKGALGFVFAHGVVFTGPGRPLKTAGASYAWSNRILHGANVYTRLQELASERYRRVAVIGGGETAASAVLALMRADPYLEIDVIYRGGAVYTRGESYAENRRFTNPVGWQDLTEEERSEFIRRTDKGVFSVAANDKIDEAENVQIINGEVLDLHETPGNVDVQLRRRQKTVHYQYDAVVVAIGYDATEPFDLLPLRARGPRKVERLRNAIDEHLRIPHPFWRVRDHSEYVNLHFPMLAGHAQGPGFPNLSSLGVLSDRILTAYVSAAQTRGHPGDPHPHFP